MSYILAKWEIKDMLSKAVEYGCLQNKKKSNVNVKTIVNAYLIQTMPSIEIKGEFDPAKMPKHG